MRANPGAPWRSMPSWRRYSERSASPPNRKAEQLNDEDVEALERRWNRPGAAAVQLVRWRR